MKPNKIVLKITDDIDPSEVLCTTYQMRNMYAQFGDAFASRLDIMNYIQHHAAVLRAPANALVLDVCCGRCLLLPLLRWNRKNIRGYIGVDIEPNNYIEATRRSATKDIRDKKLASNWLGEGDPYYPFEVHFIESNVAEMSYPLREKGLTPVDYVVYTAAIEHMQKDAGLESLKQCWEVMRGGAELFLSSPNTSEKRDPYDTQYAAHLYEWPREELRDALLSIGFTIIDEFGLVAKTRGFVEKLQRIRPDLVPIFNRLSKYLPSDWLYSLFPVLVPEISDEIVLIARK